jgi:hypothetical protein
MRKRPRKTSGGISELPGYLSWPRSKGECLIRRVRLVSLAVVLSLVPASQSAA